MLSFTTLSSLRSDAIRSSTGATAWHGPHHSAQKSTSTGSPLCSTSFSNVASVTSVAIQFPFSLSFGSSDTRSAKGKNAPQYTSLPDGPASLPAAADGARPSRPRGGDPHLVGRGGDLRQAPGAEPRRPDVLLHGRPDHGQQPGRSSPRPRPHAEGRLP